MVVLDSESVFRGITEWSPMSHLNVAGNDEADALSEEGALRHPNTTPPAPLGKHGLVQAPEWALNRCFQDFWDRCLLWC